MPTSCSLSNNYRLVCLSPFSRIQGIDKVRVVEVDLVRVDAHNRTFKTLMSELRQKFQQSMVAHTVFSVHIVHSLEVFAPSKDFIINLVPICHCWTASDTVSFAGLD